MYTRLKEAKNENFFIGGREYKVLTGGADSFAKPQASFGIQMYDVGALITQLSEMHEGQAGASGPSKKQKTQMPPPEKQEAALRLRITGDKDIGNSKLDLGQFKLDAEGVLKSLPKWNDPPNGTTP